MASKIQIYNLALSHIGMRKLFDTTTQNPSLEACELHYPTALEDTYAEHSWSFATVKSKFAQVSADVVGWEYVYAYPPKAAVVNYVFSAANVKFKAEQDFEIVFLPESNKKVVCSNEPEAYQEYVHMVEDTTLFSPKFVLATSFKLAALIAPSLIADPEKAELMRASARGIINEAKRINFGEKEKRPEQTNEIVESRG